MIPVPNPGRIMKIPHSGRANYSSDEIQGGGGLMSKLGTAASLHTVQKVLLFKNPVGQ
jgi:hypothetical protein